MNNRRTVLALLTGMATGAILGILFAPGKGSETREKIANSAKRVADNIKETAQKSTEAFSDLKEKLFNKIKHDSNGHDANGGETKKFRSGGGTSNI